VWCKRIRERGFVAITGRCRTPWDPAELLRGERDAYRLLFSNLDPEQQAVYDQLVGAGVIPPYQD
jgi:hypothetical protein